MANVAINCSAKDDIEGGSVSNLIFEVSIFHRYITAESERPVREITSRQRSSSTSGMTGRQFGPELSG